MAIAVSPRYLDTDFPKPWSLHSKIVVFADQEFGWQLDIAEELTRNPHAGFAILSIVLSYFETIAKFEAGDPTRMSKQRFKEGLRSVLGPHVAAAQLEVPEEFLDAMYEDARCGMYHSSMTGGTIVISNQPAEIFQWNGNLLVINPLRLVEIVRRHFASYIGRLLSDDPADDDLRRAFEVVFESRSEVKTGRLNG